MKTTTSYALTDADIQVARAQMDRVNTRWVGPLSFGLASWDISQRTVEDTVGQMGLNWDHMNSDQFLSDANLTSLYNQYDAIAFFWPRVNAQGVDPWGCCGAVGGGRGMLSVPNIWVRSFPNPDTAEVWLHEWLHVAEGYRSKGFSMGIEGIHGTAQHGFPVDRPGKEGDWIDWYRVFMRGQVREGDAFVGIPPRAWLLGPRLNW